MIVNSESRDSLCRYYTDASLGDTLISLIGGSRPSTILDLASGHGALSVAAEKRWKLDKLVTVDMDVSPKCFFESSANEHQHIIANALDKNLSNHISAKSRRFDLVLCNPPYKVLERVADHSDILGDVGLLNLFGNRKTIIGEIAFMAQAIRLSENGSRIGLILPDGIVTGRKNLGLRRILLRDHRVECVAQLPAGAFKKTEARAFILILTKGLKPNSSIKLCKINKQGNVIGSSIIDALKAEQRMDFDYHEIDNIAYPTLSKLNASIVRGGLDMSHSFSKEFPFFHTTHFPKGTCRNAYALPAVGNRKEQNRLPVAEAGDILVARVGRNLSEKVCGIVSGQAIFSSCVFRIRVDTRWHSLVLQALLSPLGASFLTATSRGVGARMLGKKDLLEMPIPLLEV